MGLDANRRHGGNAMLDLNRDLDTPSDSRHDTSGFIRRLKEAGQPIVLTINGKTELVIQDKASFQRLLELAERVEDLEITRQAVAEMEAGLGRPVEEMFAEIRQVLAEKPVR
jgi:PHD/YefM family antitoxin component YafN of YafNO toxin-antitoxin module